MSLRREQQFFSPMGAGVRGDVFTPTGGAGTPPPPGQGPSPRAIRSDAAGTPGKLAAQEMYWRWFQLADAGVGAAGSCSRVLQPSRPSSTSRPRHPHCLLPLPPPLHARRP